MIITITTKDKFFDIKITNSSGEQNFPGQTLRETFKRLIDLLLGGSNA